MEKLKKLSVITTVYYNEQSLISHAEELNKIRGLILEQLNIELELIYVDDGSGDDSLSILKKIKEKYPQWTTILKLSKNFGAMSAVSAGLSVIQGDCFTVLAADLQDPPSLLIDLLKLWLEGSDFSICVRNNRDDPVFTTLFSKTFNFLARKLILNDYPKGGYDIFLFDKKYLPIIRSRAKNFNLQLFCYWLGVKPKIIYFSRPARQHGKSRWTFRKKFKLMIDSFVGFSSTPIRYLSGVGTITAIASFIYCAFICINAILGRIPVSGYASTICIISFLLGIVILMLGIICEYLIRIYDQVNNKPEYIIEKIY